MEAICSPWASQMRLWQLQNFFYPFSFFSKVHGWSMHLLLLLFKLLRIRASNAEIIHFVVLHKLLITVPKLALLSVRTRKKMLVKSRRWGLLKLDRHFLWSICFSCKNWKLYRLKYHQRNRTRASHIVVASRENWAFGGQQYNRPLSVEVKQTWWPSFEPIIRLLTILKLCSSQLEFHSVSRKVLICVDFLMYHLESLERAVSIIEAFFDNKSM